METVSSFLAFSTSREEFPREKVDNILQVDFLAFFNSQESI
jgi:hypothetical protein